MKKQVVLYKKLSPLLMARLHEHAEVTLIESLDAEGLGKLRDALPRAHGLLGASLKLDAELLDLAPHLEAIASVSVGVDNYDIDYLTERRILLSNTPDVLTETTADTGFALILATARRVVELANMVRAGEWKRNVGPAQFGIQFQAGAEQAVGAGQGLAQLGQAFSVEAVDQRHFSVFMQPSHQQRREFFVQNDLLFHRNTLNQECVAAGRVTATGGRSRSLAPGLRKIVSTTESINAPLINRYDAPGEPVELFR